MLKLYTNVMSNCAKVYLLQLLYVLLIAVIISVFAGDLKQMHKTNVEAYDSGGRVTRNPVAPRTGDHQITLNTEVIFSLL